MSSNFRGPTALSGFWKRRPGSSDTQGGPSIPTLDDDYPPPPGQRNPLKTVLLWVTAGLGVAVLLGLILVVPGLLF